MADLNDMDFINSVIRDIVSVKNIHRKRNEYISYECGSGLLRKYVQAKVQQMYPKTWDTYTIAEYSLIKKVVDKKAKAYKEAPIRRLDNTDTITPDSETANYLDLLKKCRFNDAMKEIDRIYNQHKSAGLYFEPEICEDGTTEINFYPLRPYEFDLIKDDDGEVECLILSYPGAQVTRGTQELLIAGDRADDDLYEIEYVFWTKDQHACFEVTHDRTEKMEDSVRDIRCVEIENNPNNINPYGEIPFAYLPFDFNEDYPSPSPLASQTIELNALLSVYLTSANMQVGQLVLSFPADQKIEQVSSGLMTAMQLPQSKSPEDKPSDAKYISPAPNLAGHKDAIVTYLTMILDEQGINSAQVLTGAEKFSSGLDRLLSQSDVQSIIEDNQDFYTRFEQCAYEKINALLGGKYKSDFIQVIFKKPKMLSSDTEKLANLAQMIELGLIEDYEKFIEFDPNMTVEQAKEKLARIKAQAPSSMNDLANVKKAETAPIPKVNNP